MPVPRHLGAPDVTVVVIGYNDSANIGAAIRSVQQQTLANLEVVVVDDASDDGTADVADRFARKDPRVRVVRLPENSGGCSRPRNTGMEHARAPYVMFLDSDDQLERHACKNLLVEAERTGAQVVAGQCRQIFVDRRRERTWFRHLYAQRAVLAGVRDNPELFFDPLSTNKLYELAFLRKHGITFPEGVHYEDSLFTAKVYCLVERLAVLPVVVYYWRVLSHAADRSITQRRFEFENFRDRVAVHRLIDEFLVEHDLGALKPAKDFKFVRHDLRLYLNDLPHRNAAYQRRFIDLAADYLATMDRAALDNCLPVERICVEMILRRDIAETVKTVAYLKHGYKIATRLVEDDGRVYWSDKFREWPDARAALDVTSMGLQRLPFDQLPLYNVVTASQVRGGRVSIEGSVVNQFGRISAGDDLRLSASLRNRRVRGRRSVPMTVVRVTPDRVDYRGELPLGALVELVDRARPWEARLEIEWNGQSQLTPFTVDPTLLSGRPIPVRNRFGVVDGFVEGYATFRLNLAFRRTEARGSSVSELLGRPHRTWRRVARTTRRRSRRVTRNPQLLHLAYRAFQRLPVLPGVVVFESHMGRQYSDSPRYIYEAARSAGLLGTRLRPVWSFAGRRLGFPRDATLVRRGSWAFHYYLARAEFWVDNQGFPRQFGRRSRTTYVQTWHGTPLKRMGFDSPALEQAGPAARRAHRAMIGRWSTLLVPSEYFVDTFVTSYGYRGDLMRVGLPRNDPLVRGVADEWVAAKKEQLRLPPDRRVVLYAPTFRDRARRLHEQFQLPIDLAQLQEELGEDIVLLVRTHYLDRVRISGRYTGFVTDVSRQHDVTELMLVSDVLVTDYSSVMFDFANTGKPMVFFAHDYEEYVRDERGTYVDLPDIAPGPVVTTTSGLVGALRDVDADRERFANAYASFRARFCTYEKGEASERVVRDVLARGAHR